MKYIEENQIYWLKLLTFCPDRNYESSVLTLQGEFAHLIPGHQRAVGESGTAYIDDFEASSTGIDIKSPARGF